MLRPWLQLRMASPVVQHKVKLALLKGGRQLCVQCDALEQEPRSGVGTFPVSKDLGKVDREPIVDDRPHIVRWGVV